MHRRWGLYQDRDFQGADWTVDFEAGPCATLPWPPFWLTNRNMTKGKTGFHRDKASSGGQKDCRKTRYNLTNDVEKWFTLIYFCKKCENQANHLDYLHRQPRGDWAGSTSGTGLYMYAQNWKSALCTLTLSFVFEHCHAALGKEGTASTHHLHAPHAVRDVGELLRFCIQGCHAHFSQLQSLIMLHIIQETCHCTYASILAAIVPNSCCNCNKNNELLIKCNVHCVTAVAYD